MTNNIRLGISACLLGENVRYNGQHKHDRFITDTLGKYVEFVPVCPEVECGLGVPREPMRLVGHPANPKLMTRDTNIDMTDKMNQWIHRRLKQLEKENLCGFIFKSRSPSSGMERVKVYNGHGGMSGRAPGLFAKAFMERFPLLPVEDEGRLNDPELRENFIERIFALNSYHRALQQRRKPAALVKWHEQNKFLLMSHNQQRAREMGRLVSGAGKNDAGIFNAYEELLLQTLRLPATPAKHTNVLQHMLGFLKKELTADEKNETAEIVKSFKNGEIPLIVPVTLLKHYVRKYRIEYLAGQSYLNPHPLELKLRNHA
jgi:uncharacterized protein YbgA (DUF1722 family)/uncharacterized protein YbbK (DUF523 family)